MLVDLSTPRASLISAQFFFCVLRASLSPSEYRPLGLYPSFLAHPVSFPFRVSLRLRLAVSPVDQEEKKSRGLHSKCSKCADDLRLGKQRHLNGVRFGRPAAAGAQPCRCRGRGGHQRHQRCSMVRRSASSAASRKRKTQMLVSAIFSLVVEEASQHGSEGLMVQHTTLSLRWSRL